MIMVSMTYEEEEAYNNNRYDPGALGPNKHHYVVATATTTKEKDILIIK